MKISFLLFIRHLINNFPKFQNLRRRQFIFRKIWFCLAPTGALRKIPDDDVNLTNLPGLCTGCGLCRDVCFNKAVTVTPVPSELSALRPVKLGLKPAPKDNETLWEDRLQAMMPDVPIYRI